MKKLLTIAAMALGIAAGPANAVDIDWTFSGLFDDGTQVNGTFRYQMATNSYVDINLNLLGGSGGEMLPDALLNSETVFSQSPPGTPEFVPDLANLSGQPMLIITDIDFSDDGNLSPIVSGSNAFVSRCGNSSCLNFAVSGVLVEGELFGVVPAVPLPAGLPLLAGGLAALGLARRYRRG